MKRGACPTLFEPMQTGDGLLVRVKPPGGVLSAEAARTVAAAASRLGNGVIEATARANLQVRGLRPEAVEPFANATLAAGLAHPDPAVERRRNVIGTPLAGLDPQASRHAGPVAAALEAALTADTHLSGLPPKFGFAVDGGGVLGLGQVRADIRIRLFGDRCEVGLDGGKLAAPTGPAQAAEVARPLAHAFLELGGAPARMRELVAELGEAAVFAAAGLDGVPETPPDPAPPAPAGFLPDVGVFAVALPFGTIAANALARLADTAERYGEGSIRLTPWRALLLPGVADSDASAVETVVADLDLITDPSDRRLSMAACPGRPACGSATVDTRRLASAVAALDLAGTVHVSGCAKGCAHPRPAAITLIGREGRFDLVRNGSAGDPPIHLGLSQDEAIALLREPAEATA